jgi:hypothetical protein
MIYMVYWCEHKLQVLNVIPEFPLLAHVLDNASSYCHFLQSVLPSCVIIYTMSSISQATALTKLLYPWWDTVLCQTIWILLSTRAVYKVCGLMLLIWFELCGGAVPVFLKYLPWPFFPIRSHFILKMEVAWSS